MKRFDNLFLLGLTSLLTPLGAFAQVAPADQGTINERSHAVTRRETARPVRLTVSPKGQSPIAMTTLPNATCSLHPEGDATRSIQLNADEEGIVRFHAGGSEEANYATAFALDCEAGGVAQTFPVEVRPNSVPTTDMPAPAKEVRKAKPGSFVQPALTEFEAAALSDEDLAARGYPRRPNPKDAKGHASWLKVVTQPMTFVPPNPVANPGISHAPSCCGTPSTFNWSGFQWESSAANFSSQFDWVTGTWLVPAVTGPNNGPRAYSAFFVGLDGLNTFIPGTNQQDLVQAGTEQDALTTNGTTVSNYYAWYQFSPHDPFENKLTSFVNVHPGDEMMCAVWIGPAQSSLPPALSGPVAWFVVYNVTQAEYTLISESRTYLLATLPGQPHIFRTINVPGLEAEWIMERPTVNGKLPDLADFGTAEMWGAYARWDTTGFAIPLNGFPSTLVYANGSGTLPITMYGIGKTAATFDLLASPRATPTPTVLDFDWHAFH